MKLLNTFGAFCLIFFITSCGSDPEAVTETAEETPTAIEEVVEETMTEEVSDEEVSDPEPTEE
tara:strand:- start:298 stop:486 length:189 start_codon:yes stop_codon:yes gene_type:complete